MKVLEVKDVSKSFNGIKALNKCNVDVENGLIYGLIGPNGSGKTTLFNVITGFLKPDEGEILFKGENITNLPSFKIAHKGIGRTFQLTRVFSHLTLVDNLVVAVREGMDAEKKAIDLLKSVGLENLKNEYAKKLSVGQRKLLEFARVLMMDPMLILLDEPTSGIDASAANKLANCVREKRDEGKTFIIVEHKMGLIMNLCEIVYVLHKGAVIAKGTPEEIRKKEEVIEAYLGCR